MSDNLPSSATEKVGRIARSAASWFSGLIGRNLNVVYIAVLSLTGLEALKIIGERDARTEESDKRAQSNYIDQKHDDRQIDKWLRDDALDRVQVAKDVLGMPLNDLLRLTERVAQRLRVDRSSSEPALVLDSDSTALRDELAKENSYPDLVRKLDVTFPTGLLAEKETALYDTLVHSCNERGSLGVKMAEHAVATAVSVDNHALELTASQISKWTNDDTRKFLETTMPKDIKKIAAQASDKDDPKLKALIDKIGDLLDNGHTNVGRWAYKALEARQHELTAGYNKPTESLGLN